MTETEEQRAVRKDALQEEIEARAARGDDGADAKAALKALIASETKRTGSKATRLKGEGRSA